MLGVGGRKGLRGPFVIALVRCAPSCVFTCPMGSRHGLWTLCCQLLALHLERDILKMSVLQE